MSYSIHYGPEEPQKERSNVSGFGFIGVVLIIVVCLLAFGWHLPQQAHPFKEALFPWTRSEVVSAFAQLREDVVDGMPLRDAVTDFCLEIIHESDQTQ